MKIKISIVKIFIITFCILLVWSLLAQSCMQFRISDEKARKQFADKGLSASFITEKVENKKIHYVKTGSDTAATIVFVHGTPGSWNAFQQYLMDTDLIKHYRLISIDRPGFGYSDFGEAENLARQSQLMSPVLQQLKNGKPIWLVGHSLGGPMVVKLAADNPALFDKIIILAGSNDPAQEKPEKWRPVLIQTPLRLLVPGSLRPSNQELWYLKKDLVDLQKDFPKITAPVLIMHGNKDQLVPYENAAYTQKMLINAKDVQLITFDGENHFIPWTRYQEIKAELMKLR
jgi:pimeloyl-ACP methyl ester carboxylesterase